METGASVSKRSILSEISNFFDCLGLLGPIIVLAKLIIPELWQLNLYWDESIPPDIDFRWRRLKDQLHIIKQYSLPRCVKVQNRNVCNFMGFATRVSEPTGRASTYVPEQETISFALSFYAQNLKSLQ